MNRSESKKRIEKLRETITRHRYLYHVLDKQEISDEALDSLKKELFDLEQKYPEFITPDSPTQRVGGKPLTKFSKVEHKDAEGNRIEMRSLNDAFSEEDVSDWIKRVEKNTGKKIGEFYADLKMDGLAVELVYKNGILEQGSTRGDGRTGEDVVNNIKTIEAIPLKLTGSEIPNTLVVRGEVFLTKKEFEKINKEQKKAGLKEYANPRNLAAGSIRQLDPKVSASRNLDFFAYGIPGQTDDYFEQYPTRRSEYDALNKFGIKTNPYGKVLKNYNDIIQFQKKWAKERIKLPYEIDGLVISLNDNDLYRKAGIAGKAPRGAVAYKFSPKEAETIVEDIIVQVGRTGILTPVAKLKPVSVGGTVVSRATLHNLDEIKRLGVKTGDTVVVGRAGDVIPDVKKVLKELRTGKEKEFHMPKKCPACGELIRQTQGEVAYKCVNKNCPAREREAIYHFVSRKAFDIDGIGPKIIDQLIDAALINDAADLFTLEKEDLLNLERFAEKSAENTINAIQENKKVPLDKFIYSLGIEHVGEETALLLARQAKAKIKIQKSKLKIKELVKFFEQTGLEELRKIPDIGPVVAKSIFDWFQKSYNKKLLEKFDKAGVEIIAEKVSAKSEKLAGKMFVLTGTLESLGRDDAKDRIRELGGDVSSSVSKETDYVVVGIEPGSKYDKAKRLKVKVLDEKEFLKILK